MVMLDKIQNLSAERPLHLCSFVGREKKSHTTSFKI